MEKQLASQWLIGKRARSCNISRKTCHGAPEKQNKNDEEPMEKIKQLQAELELEIGNKGFQKVAVVREQAEKESRLRKKLGK